MSYKKYIVLVLLLLLIGLRFTGDLTFRVEPQQKPEIVVNTETTLSQSVQRILENNGNAEKTLFFPLYNPQLALASRVMLADQAEDAIATQYYLFHDDQAGRALLGAMIEAAERGVQVRLLLDDMDTKGRDGLFIRLAEELEHLQVRVFNPSWLRDIRAPEYLARFPRVTRRMHNKSYSVDKVASIVGGRNIGDEYFALADEVNFTDFDILAGGKLVTEVVDEFDTYWYSGLAFEVQKLNGRAADDSYQQWRKRIAEDLQFYRQLIQQNRELAVHQLLDSSLKPYFDEGRVIFDPPEKVVSSLFSREQNLASDIIDIMKEAQQTLLISSPYFIPSETGMQMFRELRERNVEIRILTNALKTNDVAMVHAGYMDYREELVEIGVELFELKPHPSHARNWQLLGSKQASLHAKAFIVDQQRIFVGSFNLDPRSALHNTEMGIVFDSPEYAREVYSGMDKYMVANAYRVSMDEQGALRWEEQNADQQLTVHSKEPGTNAWERAIISLLSWLPVEWLL